MSTHALNVDGQARVLRPAVPDRPRERRHQSVVVWNLDGTLTRRDTLLPLLRRVGGTLRASQAAGAVAGRRLAGGGHDSARALLLQQVLGGRTTAVTDAIGQRYAQDLLAHRLRADALHRRQWHQHHGHRLIIASPSPDFYVRHLGADTVIYTRMAAVNGRITGGECHNAERARQFVAQPVERPPGPVRAHGNLPADRDLLDLADIGIRVRPLRHLYAMTHS